MSNISYIYQHKKWVLLSLLVFVIAMGLGQYANKLNGKVNISRDEYNQALDRWHSKKVTHYRIRVDRRCGGRDGCGIYDVAVAGADVKVHSWEFGSIHSVNDPPVYDAAGELFTVDSLFHQVDRILSDGVRQENGVSVDYMIDFDPVYGYPKYIYGRGREPEDGNVSSMVWHVGETWVVEAFEEFRVLP